MANRWNIPPGLERDVRKRDLSCIYCGVVFSDPPNSRGEAASWEHIINDASIITPDNIALCCCSCNASKGRRPLGEWLRSAYCQRRGITKETIAAVAKVALSNAESETGS